MKPNTSGSKFFPLVGVVLLLLCRCEPRSSAQLSPAQSILYEGYHPGANRFAQQLGALNPDGSADHVIWVDLPETLCPTWSRDGRLLALSSVRPELPFALSRNVFVVDMRAGQIARITSFADTVGSGGGAGSNQLVSACVLPWYKAFSPDGTHIAVAGVVLTGTTQSIPTNQVPDPTLVSGFQGTPALQIYGLDGTPGVLVHADNAGTDTIHGGDGVDWSPTQDLLVYPTDTTFPVNNFGQILQVPVTALALMPPVNDAVGSGQATQLTFPEASTYPSWNGPVTTYETDYQPAFSPDGKRVAYLRAQNIIIGAYPQLPSITLRLVNTDGSNDRELVSFQQGTYCSHVSWAPDGSRLVFDAGQEVVNGGIPMPWSDPATDALLIANADGSAVTQLRKAPAAWPAWYPGPAIGGDAAPPRLDPAPQAGGRQLVLSWPVDNRNFVLQSSSSVGPQAQWIAEATQPAISSGRATMVLNYAPGAKFYRLVQQ